MKEQAAHRMNGSNSRRTDDGAADTVSVIMSNYRGAAYLAAAVRSVLGQTHSRIELIVADDASDDDSVAILNDIAREDPRLIPVALTDNGGPGAARNAALERARGDWIAIVDSDDILHPRRIERLLAAAKRLEADMIADDMVQFGDREVAGTTVLGGRDIGASLTVSPAAFVDSDGVSAGVASFGYLKPMIRRAFLGSRRYNARLRIGEDFDLCLRLLIDGARYVVVPDPTYLYRRHAGSISHRLTEAALESLLAAHADAAKAAARSRPGDATLHRALDDRAGRLERGLDYERLVRAIKSRRPLSAASRILRHPALLGDLRASLADRRAKGRIGSVPQDRAPLTLVLGSASCAADAPAPAGAVRMAVPPLRSPGSADGDDHVALACRLTALAEGRAVRVLAFGAEGLCALGYLPEWDSAMVTLAPAEAERAVLPPRADLAVLPPGG